MKIKFKKLHPYAKLPTKGTELSAGFDIYLPEYVSVLCSLIGGVNAYYGCKVIDPDGPNLRVVIPLGIAVELPAGFAAMLLPRSSRPLLGFETTGLIDEDYRGELALQCILPRLSFNEGCDSFDFRSGGYLEAGAEERIAQLVPFEVPRFEPEWTDELSDTDRGNGGFGSTGK